MPVSDNPTPNRKDHFRAYFLTKQAMSTNTLWNNYEHPKKRGIIVNPRSEREIEHNKWVIQQIMDSHAENFKAIDAEFDDKTKEAVWNDIMENKDEFVKWVMESATKSN